MAKPKDHTHGRTAQRGAPHAARTWPGGACAVYPDGQLRGNTPKARPICVSNSNYKVAAHTPGLDLKRMFVSFLMRFRLRFSSQYSNSPH